MEALYVTQKLQVPLEDIRYLQADINYTIIHTNQQKSIVSATTIKRLNDRIDSNSFIRINKKYVLNRRIIKSYNGTESSVMIDDGQVFILSRRKEKSLKAILEQI